MSTQVIRVESYTMGSLGAIGRECDRAEGVNHRNVDIRTIDSPNNVSYVDADGGFYGKFKDIVSDCNAQYKPTKTGTAFEGIIVTADLEFFKSMGYEQGKPLPKEVKSFFDSSYEFVKSAVGYQGTDKNILSAKIHLDEKTPHLHLYYVPITDEWQTKVYAKDETGKVLRNSKGSPIQAKGSDGKTLYERHIDAANPKLSRTEFWRVRGGQHSYRMLQDCFYEQVGKGYHLDRGEVGSDRKHKKTAVYKQEQLTKETEKLEKKLERYENLSVQTDAVEEIGKSILPGVVAVKKQDLMLLKSQAESYIVNRDSIATLIERQRNVRYREVAADERELSLDKRANELSEQTAALQQQYLRQQHLNELLEAAERDRDYYRKRSRMLEEQNLRLKTQFETIKKEITEKMDLLLEKLRGAYVSLANIVKAVGMLKYDKSGEYQIENLTEEQSNLIDGLAEYGAHWARSEGYEDLADDMEHRVGLSNGIKSYVEPSIRTYQHSHDDELSL